jgi:cellulose synthase/poly-beta-1,6-N-acetylglucosamine synthase-like glycosyltransferase
MTPFFTIIIPVKAINDYVRETIPYIQNLLSPNWELIILPNDADLDEWHDTRIQIIPSGRVGPAKKRDMGAELARGEILVFLDDDSYPEPNILNIAEHYFTDNNVVALGGPAMTPKSDSFWQRVSGAVFLSKFSGGAPERYVPIGPPRPVDDWPSVNLMVRKKEFLQIGGFNSIYWPGEDTKLCLDLIKKTGKTILYIPEMRVWHHRRAGLLTHLRQVGGYGLHRGYFAKRYPESSRRIKYFAPSALLLYLFLSLLLPLIWPNLALIFLVGWMIYGGAVIKAWLDIRTYESRAIATAAVVYVIATHLWYGTLFIRGLLTQNLISKLR